MNLRILKKLSKRAAPLLIAIGDRRRQYRASHPKVAGSYHQMRGFERKNWQRTPCHPSETQDSLLEGVLFLTRDGRKMVKHEPPHALKGTVMIGEDTGCYGTGWDEQAAYASLIDHVYCRFADFDQEGLAVRRPLKTPKDIFAAAAVMIEEIRGNRSGQCGLVSVSS